MVPYYVICCYPVPLNRVGTHLNVAGNTAREIHVAVMDRPFINGSTWLTFVTTFNRNRPHVRWYYASGTDSCFAHETVPIKYE